ncbi:MAG TPA: nucleotide exchange factor GrpE, partial [Allosphingosinicella sp.]
MNGDEQTVNDEAQQAPEDVAAENAERTENAENDRLAQLEKELEDVRQHVLYAQAETQNVRRRLEQEKQSAATYAATGFARDMLSVKDNLERALAAVPETLRDDEQFKPFLAGIEATARELDSVFNRNGITRVAAMGLPLDPNKHQAMIEIPSEDAEPGTIVLEMQAVYMIKDRL